MLSFLLLKETSEEIPEKFRSLAERAIQNSKVKVPAAEREETDKPGFYKKSNFEFKLKKTLSSPFTNDIKGFAKEGDYIAIAKRKAFNLKESFAFVDQTEQKLYSMKRLVAFDDKVNVYFTSELNVFDIMTCFSYEDTNGIAVSKSFSHNWNNDGLVLQNSGYKGINWGIGGNFRPTVRTLFRFNNTKDILLRVSVDMKFKCGAGVSFGGDSKEFVLLENKFKDFSVAILGKKFKIKGFEIEIGAFLKLRTAIENIKIDAHSSINLYKGYDVYASKYIEITPFSVTNPKWTIDIYEHKKGAKQSPLLALKARLQITFALDPYIDFAIKLGSYQTSLSFGLMANLIFAFGFDNVKCSSPHLYGSSDFCLKMFLSFSGLKIGPLHMKPLSSKYSFPTKHFGDYCLFGSENMQESHIDIYTTNYKYPKLVKPGQWIGEYSGGPMYFKVPLQDIEYRLICNNNDHKFINFDYGNYLDEKYFWYLGNDIIHASEKMVSACFDYSYIDCYNYVVDVNLYINGIKHHIPDAYNTFDNCIGINEKDEVKASIRLFDLKDDKYYFDNFKITMDRMFGYSQYLNSKYNISVYSDNPQHFKVNPHYTSSGSNALMLVPYKEYHVSRSSFFTSTFKVTFPDGCRFSSVKLDVNGIIIIVKGASPLGYTSKLSKDIYYIENANMICFRRSSAVGSQTITVSYAFTSSFRYDSNSFIDSYYSSLAFARNCLSNNFSESVYLFPKRLGKNLKNINGFEVEYVDLDETMSLIKFKTNKADKNPFLYQTVVIGKNEPYNTLQITEEYKQAITVYVISNRTDINKVRCVELNEVKTLKNNQAEFSVPYPFVNSGVYTFVPICTNKKGMMCEIIEKTSSDDLILCDFPTKDGISISAKGLSREIIKVTPHSTFSYFKNFPEEVKIVKKYNSNKPQNVKLYAYDFQVNSSTKTMSLQNNTIQEENYEDVIINEDSFNPTPGKYRKFCLIDEENNFFPMKQKYLNEHLDEFMSSIGVKSDFDISEYYITEDGCMAVLYKAIENTEIKESISGISDIAVKEKIQVVTELPSLDNKKLSIGAICGIAAAAVIVVVIIAISVIIYYKQRKSKVHNASDSE